LTAPEPAWGQARRRTPGGGLANRKVLSCGYPVWRGNPGLSSLAG